MRLTGTLSGAPSINSMRRAPYTNLLNLLLSRASDWTSLSILNTRPESSGVRSVSVARAGQRGRPEDNSRIRQGQEKDKRRKTTAGQEKTRGAQDPATEFRGTASQCGQGWSARPQDKGWSARPQDNSRTREGQQHDKKRTRPGHRIQGRGQS